MASFDPSAFPGGLQTIAEREAALLAPYAMHSVDSRGRVHPEPPHPYRGPFQRDRDRIVHSAAYRRLSGKMQVFTGDKGDYHRTRLTHTQEVASIARTIGRALRLNEDLIEALALVHDIGHPPFGHAGEDALDECLADEGGFSHNRQALALVESLEQRYPDVPGLNLTREVLQGQTSRIDKQAAERPLLEVQVVDVSDGITYSSHDVDDAVKLQLVTLDELQDIALCRQCTDDVHRRFPGLSGKPLRRALVHRLIERQVNDVLERAAGALKSHDQLSADEIRRQVRIEKSNALTESAEQLQTFLYQRVYRHEDLVKVRQAAQQRLRVMFQGYARRPELMPQRFRDRAEAVGLRRAIADYLAGMTDRYCDDQYRRHFSANGP
ncbi:MAG: dNTP triphosphohydrolase [Pirellulaceae bacterium]